MAASNIVNISSVKEAVNNSKNLIISENMFPYRGSWQLNQLNIDCKKLSSFVMRVREEEDMYSRHTISLDGNAKRLGGWLTMRLGERNWYYWKLEGKDATTEGVIEFIQELDQALDWIYSK